MEADPPRLGSYAVAADPTKQQIVRRPGELWACDLKRFPRSGRISITDVKRCRASVLWAPESTDADDRAARPVVEYQEANDNGYGTRAKGVA